VLIQLNGEPLEVAEKMLLTELVASLQLKPEQVAVEVNQVVVRRTHWEATQLHTGDKIEIVHFVGGGSEAWAVSRSSRQAAKRGL
jgi:thiazole synthase